MLKYFFLALLVSTFFVFGFNTNSMAAVQTEESKVLIKCSTCGVEFTSMPLAEQHMKTSQDHASAHPLIKCSTCGVEFTAQAGLKKHPQVNADHQGTPLIKCSTCGVEFTSPES